MFVYAAPECVCAEHSVVKPASCRFIWGVAAYVLPRPVASHLAVLGSPLPLQQKDGIRQQAYRQYQIAYTITVVRPAVEQLMLQVRDCRA